VSRLVKPPDEETTLTAILRQMEAYRESSTAGWLPTRMKIALQRKIKRHQKTAKEFSANFKNYEPK
jgi:hypothetical protein